MVGKHLTRQCNSVQVMCVVAMVWLYQCILVYGNVNVEDCVWDALCQDQEGL